MAEDPGDLDLDLEKPVAEPPPEITRRADWRLIAGGVAAVLMLALAGGYLARRLTSRPPATVEAPVDRAAPQRDKTLAEEITLPPLDESDPLVRQLVERLSSHPTVAAWLTTDGLLLNFAVVTRQVANGENPMRELAAFGSLPPFRSQTTRRGDVVIDPASYRRYDAYAAAVSALDARGTARLYTTLKPRILDAYRRLGEPTGDFDPVLERAITEALEVPVVRGDVELEPKGIGFAFADPKLEELTPAQKHLLRMGPENLEKVQRKLREIADYLGIPASRLPQSK